MEIKELKLFSKYIEEQYAFYNDILGFTCKKTSQGFTVITKENTLEFIKSEKDCYYHFAFLIPTGSIHAAIQYLEERNIDLLRYKGEKIIHFQTGKAIYFYDKDGNIGEFIERPLLDYAHSSAFSINQVIKLNEIGLPHKDPLYVSAVLINEYGITPIDQNSFRENFCWVGDHNGVIIVVKEGRNWLPTNKPGIINDFVINYQDNGKTHHLSFENNAIRRVK